MGVALITPFKEDGSVDYKALVKLVEYQLLWIMIILLWQMNWNILLIVLLVEHQLILLAANVNIVE